MSRASEKKAAECWTARRGACLGIAAGVQHAVDLRAVFGPLLDLVEVGVIRMERIVGKRVRPVIRAPLGVRELPGNPPATLSTTTLMLVATAITFLAFTLSALASDRLGHRVIAAFLAAGAWLSAAALAFVIWFAFWR
jgi:hypothetical protein